jgi:PKD repeat protein
MLCGVASAIPGVDWTQGNTTSPAVQRYGQAQWTDGNDIYVAGGRMSVNVYMNDTWKSSDNGTTWTQVNASGGWSVRNFLWGVNHNGTFVIGSGSNATVTGMNDTWKSTDKGATWTQVNSSLPWGSYHAQMVIVALDRIIALGGFDSTEKRVDYYSTDYGATWTQVTAAPEWGDRELGAVFYDSNNDTVLMSGGKQSTYRNDVWKRQRTGTTWTQVTSNAGYTAVYGMAYAQFDGKYWIIGGVDGSLSYNQVWYAVDPTNQTSWQQVSSTAPMLPRYYCTASGTPTNIVYVGGQNAAGTYLNASYNTSITPGICSDTWGDTNFSNRAPIQFVTNNTNEHVKVIVPFNSSMQPNQRDFKFLTTGGVNIPFWIENTSQVNSSYVTLWTNPPTNQNKIFLYFNNTTQTSLSNSSIFPLFDHFDGSTILTASGSPTLSYSGSTVTISGGGSTYRGLKAGSTLGTSTMLRAYMKRTGTGSHYEYMGYDENRIDAGGENEVYLSDNLGTQYLYTKATTGSNSASLGTSNTNYHYFDIMRNGTTDVKYFNDGVRIVTKTTNIPSAALNPFLAEYDGSLVVDWIAGINGTDNIFAYYNTPEQSVTVLTPVANFTANATTGTSPLNVSFTDSSTNTPTSWYWEFGDGNNTTTQNPTHLYYTGNWSVNMSATNAAGTDWFNGTWINVTAGAAPPYTVVYFNTTGTQNWTVPSGVTSVWVLLVAGGGGGGSSASGGAGGGGGAGALINNTSYPVSGTINITVGTGGNGGTSANGTSGGNSTFGTLTVVGGGGGALTGGATQGVPGGSGGGGSGATTGGAANATGGNNGGAGTSHTGGGYPISGGGGGAGAVGSAAVNDGHGGNGGAGLNSTITGSNVTYAGGGGGTCDNRATGKYAGTGGTGGGGAGVLSGAANNGTNNLGGGGGGNGAAGTVGGTGGSGVVIIRYLTPGIPVANFTQNTTWGYNPLSVQFNDTSTGSPTSWYWDFGDSTNSTTQNATHTFSSIGDFTVKLNATNANGSTWYNQTNLISVRPVITTSWLTGYTNRQQFNITPNASWTGDKSNYVVNFNINSGAGTSSGSNIYLNNNASRFPGLTDIRITNDSGTTLLPYYNDYTLSNASHYSTDVNISKIWRQGNTSGYIYYGNSTVPPVSDGSTTYPMYQPFGGAWQVSTGAGFPAEHSIIKNGKLYGASSGLWIISADDGIVLHNYNSTLKSYTAPVIDNAGHIWMYYEFDKLLKEYDEDTGQINSVSLTTAEVIDFETLVYDSTNDLVILQLASNLRAYYGANASLAWQNTNITSDGSGTPQFTLYNGYIYARDNHNNDLYKLYSVNGTEAVTNKSYAGTGASYTQVLYDSDHDYIYFNGGTQYNFLYCAYASNLTMVWNSTFASGSGIMRGLSYHNNRIYFAGVNVASPYLSTLYCLNASTGAEIWNNTTAKDNGASYIGNVIDDNYIYITTQDYTDDSYAKLLLHYIANGTVAKTYTYSSGSACDVPTVYHGNVIVGLFAGAKWVSIPVSISTNASDLSWKADAGFTGYIEPRMTGSLLDDYTIDWTNKWQSASQASYTVSDGILTEAAIADSANLLQSREAQAGYEIVARGKLNSSTNNQVYFPIKNATGYDASDIIYFGHKNEGSETRMVAQLNSNESNNATWASNTNWYKLNFKIPTTGNAIFTVKDDAETYTVTTNTRTPKYRDGLFGTFTFVAATAQLDYVYSKPYDASAYGYGTYGAEEYNAIVPVANFNTNVTSGAQPLNVGFTDSSTNTPTSWYWEFGDGNNTTSQNPTHLYYTGNWSVNMSATNSAGTDWFNGTWINVTAGATIPDANFSVNTSSGVQPLSVQFNDTSTNTPTSWFYDFGDGNNTTDQNPMHVYSTGNWSVNMSATNSAGTDWFNGTYINVTSGVVAPVGNFTSNVTSGKIPLSVQFWDNSTNTPTMWNWSFGDGSENNTTQNPIHVYSVAGVYSVNLTAGNAAGNGTTFQQASYINASALAPPFANFTKNVSSGKVPLSVQFTDSSTNTPTSWLWQWGDGTANTTTQSPIHVFTSVGTYQVNLTATNDDGSNLSANQAVTVQALAPPVVDFTANQTTGTTPLNVSFTDNSTNTPTSWNWSFGDGNYSNTQNTTHLFYTGNWSVNLTASNADGTGYKNGTWINVTSGVVTPVASFSTNATSGKVPLSIQFTDSSSNIPTSWLWQWGDGTANTTTQSPIHVYSVAGVYQVNLTATNTAGSNISANTAITAQALAPPTANFTANVTTGTIPLSVGFTDTSNNSPTSWAWQFGDGSSNATTQNPTHVYSDVGTFSVNLTATNADGSDTEQKLYYITTAAAPILPVPAFSANVTSGLVPISVQFNESSTNATTWYWDLGDGNTSIDQNPVHTYYAENYYTVKLQASNENGSVWLNKTNYLWFTNPPTPIPTATPVYGGGYAPPYQAPDVPFPTNNNTGCHLLNVSVDTTNQTVTFLGQVDNVTNDTTAWFTLGATTAANSYYTVALVPDPVSGNVTGSMGLSSPMAAGTKYYVRMASTKGLALESLNFTTPAAVALPTSTYGAYWNKVQASNKTPLSIMNAIPLPLVDLFGGSAAGAGNEFGWRIVFTLIIGLLVMVIAIRQDNLILVFMLIGLTGPVWLSLIVPEFVWIPATVCYLVAATTLYRLYRNRRS